MNAKKAKSPTGRPSKVRPEVKAFDKGGAGGGKRTSAYSKKPNPATKNPAKRKPSPSTLGSGAASKAASTLKNKRKNQMKELGL